MRSWILVLALSFAVLGACTSGEADSAQYAASAGISIQLASQGGASDGPVVVEVTLTNLTEDSLTLVRPTVTPNFVRFWVEAEDGTRMAFYGPQLRLSPLDDSGFVTLDAGQSTTESIDIGPGFQLPPGSYSLWAEYRNPAGGSHEGSRAVVLEPGTGPMSEAIDVTVTP